VVERPAAAPGVASPEMDAGLAALERPRQHYIRWYAGPGANSELMNAPQGLHAWFRAYYHAKSADWAANRPFRLADATAGELAKMPTYYIMDRGVGMAETVVPYMPSPEANAACPWFSDDEVAVYAEEYGRATFAGGLWMYRYGVDPPPEPEALTHANRAIEVPTCFISGASDWGVYQSPGALEIMQTRACSDFRGVHLVPGAGHWVQQEQPDAVVELTLRFLRGEL
jgi:pimeloyl-ACP methyl ester carboxylesterase